MIGRHRYPSVAGTGHCCLWGFRAGYSHLDRQPYGGPSKCVALRLLCAHSTNPPWNQQPIHPYMIPCTVLKSNINPYIIPCTFLKSHIISPSISLSATLGCKLVTATTVPTRHPASQCQSRDGPHAVLGPSTLNPKP